MSGAPGAPEAVVQPAAPLMVIENVRKSFDGQEILHGVTLRVMPGEFVTLLGPSGCGKTTTLRVVAGMERPDAGRVLLDGQDITNLPPEHRTVNTVFQNYALFPHMNVAQNIAYGLRVRHTDKATIRARVADMLSLVDLQGYEKRMPHQLSGGQRQRVAIARAAVLEPHLLLLDEPLGALDLKLRRQMQLELKAMQQSLGMAFVYITHDQEEALNMSDRIAIMRAGRIEQIGTPEDVYERPANVYCASFIGETNLLRGKISALTPGESAAIDMGGLTLPCRLRGENLHLNDRVCLCVRTERLRYGAAPRMGVYLSGTLRAIRYAGGTRRAIIALPTGQELVSVGQSEDATAPIPVGARVFLYWNPEHAALVSDAESGESTDAQ